MIIVRLSGGLGNQMFQYAAGLALARRHGVALRFDLEWFEAFQLHQGLELSRVFGLELPAASQADERRVLGWLSGPLLRRAFSRRSLRALRPARLGIEPHFHYWPGFEELAADVFLDGYWQSNRYFASITDEIRATFRFVMPLDDLNAVLAQEMDAVASVSLHVRRGDFARDPQVSRVHGVDLTDYYQRAIDTIGQQVANPHFYVFSDEPEWVHENLELAAPCTILRHNTGADSYRDLQLMSRCKHHILANSTFSWWGAWLDPGAAKLVIAPRRWFNDPAKDCRDLYASGWLVL